jgi:hypothetical protein
MIDNRIPLHSEVHMIGLLGWGEEGAAPRAAARGFVPQLEVLDGRVLPSHFGNVKIDFALASGPGVAVQQMTESPPGVSLLASPVNPDGASGHTGPVHVLGGEGGFDPVSVGGVGQETPISMARASPVLA